MRGEATTITGNTTLDLTTEEVAKVLRLNKVTVQRLLHARALQGYQVGDRWRVTRAALDEFRAGGTRKAGRPKKPVDPAAAVMPKRGRGRPKKAASD